MIYEIVGIRADGGESLAGTATRPDKAKEKATQLAAFLAQHEKKGPDGFDYAQVIVRARGGNVPLQTVEIDAEKLGLCGDPSCGHDHSH